MAKDTHKVIDIDVGAAQTSIKDLRKEMSGLRDALLNLKEGTEEYDKVQKKLVEDQNRINSVMNATKKQVDALPGSYNALVQELAKVKKEWKETNDLARRDELGKRAKEINDELKKLDSSVGNFQRNVGDYKNAFKDAFIGILTGSVSASNGIKMLKSSLDLLKANPVVLLSSAFTALISAIKGNERAMSGIRKGMNELEPVLNVFRNVLGIIGETLGQLIGALGNILKPLLPVITKLLAPFVSNLKALGKAFELVGNVVGKVADIFMKTLNPVFESAGKIFQKVTNIFVSGLDAMAKPFKSFINLILSGVGGAIKLMSKLPGIGDKWKPAIDALEEAKKKVQEFSFANTELFKDMDSAAKDLTSTVEDRLAGTYEGLQRQLQKLRKEWEQTNSESERVSLGIQIREVEKQIESMESSLKVASKEVLALEGSYASLQNELERLTKSWENTNDEAERGRIAVRIREVNAQMVELRSQLLATKNASDEEIEEIVKLQNSYSALKDKINSLKKAWEDAGSEAERKSIGKQIQEAQAELESMESTLRSVQKPVEILEGSYEALRMKLQALTTQWEKTNNSGERAKLAEEIKSVSSELQELSNQLKIEKEIEQKQAEEALLLTGSYDALSERLNELKKAWQSAGTEAERVSIGKQIQELEKHLDKMQESLHSTDAEIKLLEGSYASLKNQLDELTTQWENTNDQAEREVLSEKIVTLKEELEALSSQLQVVKQREEETNDINVVLSGSYDDLRTRLEELQKAWQSAGTEAERKRISTEMERIDSKMKSMELSSKSWDNSISNGIQNITKSIVSLSNPMAIARRGALMLKAAFDAVCANPIGAVLMAIVAACKLIASGFKNSESATNKLKVAFAAFEPIVNACKNALTGVANVIGDILQIIPQLVAGVQNAGVKIAEVLNKMGIVSDEKLQQMKDNIEEHKTLVDISLDLANREIAIQDRRRDLLVLEAKTEMEVAELRAKAAEKNKYTTEQITQFLEEAKNKEEALMKERLAVAQEEFDIQKIRMSLTDNTDADYDKLAQLEANLYNVKREYNDRIRALNTKLSKSEKETNSTVKQEADKTLEHEKSVIEERLKMAEEGTYEYLDIQVELENKNWQIQEKRLKDEKFTDQQIEIFRKSHMKNLEKIAEQKAKLYVSDVAEEDIDEEAPLEYLRRINEKKIALAKEYSAQYYELLRQQADFEYEQEKIKLDIAGATNEEMELLEAEHQKRLTDIEKEELEKRKTEREALRDATLDGMSDMASETTNALSTIGDAWEASLKAQLKTGKISEKEYESRKKNLQKFQIAAITAQAAASIFDVWAGYAKEVGTVNPETAAATGPLAAPTLAALNAKSLISAIAKTTALGATSVAQIAAVKSGGSSSSTSSAISATATPDTAGVYSGPSYTRNLQTDQEKAASTAPIYVSVTDINNVQNKVRVRETESTF